jgi:hypothetical protein
MKLRCNRTVKHRAAVSNERERRKTTILLISLPRSRLIQNKKLFSPLFFAGRRRLLRKEMQTSFEEVKRASLRSLTMATEPGAGDELKNRSYLAPVSVAFLLSFQLCISEKCLSLWRELGGKFPTFLFSFPPLHSPPSEESPHRKAKTKMKKLEDIYDANGFWCSSV